MPERTIGQPLDQQVAEPRRDGADRHRTTTVERGSFVSAQCTCGWRGPARRARESARTDAAAHTRAADA